MRATSIRDLRYAAVWFAFSPVAQGASADASKMLPWTLQAGGMCEDLVCLDREPKARVFDRGAPPLCDLRLELPVKRGVDLTGIEVPRQVGQLRNGAADRLLQGCRVHHPFPVRVGVPRGANEEFGAMSHAHLELDARSPGSSCGSCRAVSTSINAERNTLAAPARAWPYSAASIRNCGHRGDWDRPAFECRAGRSGKYARRLGSRSVDSAMNC